MPTPQEKLDAMLDEYQKAHKTATTDPGKQLRELIETTPGLKATFLDQIDKGRLEKFVPLTTPGALGTYAPYDKAMAVSVDQLNDAARGNVQTANSLRFTLGHEIDHAVTRDARLAEDKALEANIKRVVTGPSPHDYTETLKTYNDSVRSREVGAEIAGFNALAGYVTSKNPKATLKDMYDASPDDMKNYVDVDLSKTPATYTPKPGLTLGSDLKMASTPENVTAMGKYFYENFGYPERKVGYGLAVIASVEDATLRAARAADPSHPAPEVRVNLKEVGAPGATVPSGITDTSSPRLQSAGQSAPSGAEAPAPRSENGSNTPTTPNAQDPRNASNPDNAYFQLLREKLPSSVPDNAVAQAMLLAKQDGMTDASKVNPSEVGLVNGKIWINGNTPGFRVGLDPAQSPSMEQVTKDLGNFRQEHEQTHAQSRPLAQETQQPTTIGR
jgi:hypothetical protein